MNADIAAFINDNIDHSEISRLNLFKGVNLLSIEGILNTCPVLALEAGKILISAGQPSQVLYLLLAGRLRVHQDSLKSKPIGTIESGESIGELAVIDRRSCSVYVVADQDSRLLAVDEDRLLELINTSHAVARNFLFSLMRDLRQKSSPEPEYKRLQKKYQRVSSVDELTGLHNHRWLDDMLTRQIIRSSTNKQALSLVMIGVDKLKKFNNEFGKMLGDQALYVVTQTLMKNARPTDMIARYEGNKFSIILPSTDINGARFFAARLREVVSETEIIVPNECVLPPVTISLGIVQLKAFVAAERLLADAVAALARAKEKGGNWVSE